MELVTYLNYGGNCAEAFRFYEKHLGGKITMMMTQGENPDVTVPPERAKDVLHARITIGGAELQASDVPPEANFQPMRSVYLSLSLGSAEEAERVWALLLEGGQILMPMGETFFAHRFGMVRDKFGTSWMITHSKPMA